MHEAVARRWRDLDPLLPVPWPGAPEDTVLAVPGATGYARRYRSGDEPHSGLLWAAADRFALRALVADASPGRADPDALDRLLNVWRDWIAGQPEPPAAESTAALNWPSRDTAGVPALRRHGLSPYVVVAARTAGTPTPPAGRGPRVRRATPDDLTDIVRLYLALLHYEADFGTAYLRPQAARWLHAETARALAGPDPLIWVAEQNRTVRGVLEVQPPEAAAWLADLTLARPMAYLASLYVDPAHRGGGTGAALVHAAHHALDAAGTAVTLLHYAQVNPLSGPFWHRMGYRPLWTGWRVAPAGTLR